MLSRLAAVPGTRRAQQSIRLAPRVGELLARSRPNLCYREWTPMRAASSSPNAHLARFHSCWNVFLAGGSRLLNRIPRGFEEFWRRRPGATPKNEPVRPDAEPQPKSSEAGESSSSRVKADKAETEKTGSQGSSTPPPSQGMPEFSWRNLAGPGALVLLLWAINEQKEAAPEVSFQEFRSEYLDTGKVKKLVVVNDMKVRGFSSVKEGRDKTKALFYFTIPDAKIFERRLQEVIDDVHAKLVGTRDSYRSPRNSVDMSSIVADPNNIAIDFVHETDWLTQGVTLLPVALLGILMFNMVSSFARSGGGGGFMGVTRMQNKAVQVQKNVKTRFADIAGCDEAKVEIEEFVKFLKNPEKFKNMGAKIPRGAMLTGPPGTGKTLLAKAVAGEAQVPFFSISGSDFVELFVGVGPARVRDLFAQARKHQPAIVFIDEIDAIGKPRGRGGFFGSNDERENTLNQLLVEMDGFATGDDAVVVISSTNVDLSNLDSALIRPGRFDRQISMDKPTVIGRKAVFLVHLKKLTVNEHTDMGALAQRLAELTPGFSGAEIANVCNEGALFAARKQKNAVDLDDLQSAVDRVIGGIERKSTVLKPREKAVLAYHEAGHAIAAWMLKYASEPLKVSIIPRGIAALGYTQYLPREHYIHTREELLDNMCVALAGRIAEKRKFSHLSTGAVDDLEKVTKLAYAQVAQFGFSSEVGHLHYQHPAQDGAQMTMKPFSERTARMMDEEAREVAAAMYARTERLLADNWDAVCKVAEHLLKHEQIVKEKIIELVGHRPWVERDGMIEPFVPGTAEPAASVVDAETPEGGDDAAAKVQGNAQSTTESPSSV